MKLHELVKLTHKKSRVGRGIAAGQGKTAGRGTKGQKARTGHRNAPVGFEGGQTRLYRRLPKVSGFRSRRPPPTTITFAMLNRAFADGARVDGAALVAAGLVTAGSKARLVASGPLERAGLRLAADIAATPAARSALSRSAVAERV